MAGGLRCFNDLAVGMAREQHGIVDRRGLIRAGASAKTVEGQVRRGRLEPVFAGTYKFAGSPLTLNGLRMACVLTAGKGAVLGLESAAALWGFMPASTSIRVLKVSANKGARAKVRVDGRAEWPYLIIRRGRAIRPEEIAQVDRIPLTAVEATLRGLAGVMDEEHLQDAFDEADRLGLIDDARLLEVAANCQGFRGASSFRDLVRDRVEDIGAARSRLESLVMRAIRKDELPRPEVNVVVSGRLVDFCWRQQRVIVETDGYAFHQGRAAFEEDRARDNELRALGWTVLRFTYRQVVHNPGYVTGLIRAALTDGDRSDP